MIKICDANEIMNSSNSSFRVGEVKREIRTCVLYAWILINHYRLRDYILKNKLSREELSKPLPFYVNIIDADNDHVYMREIDGETSFVYTKIYAEYKLRREVLFIDQRVCGLTLNDLKIFVFNKNCKKNLQSRLMSNSSRTEEKTSDIIKQLRRDSTVSVISNNKDIDLIQKGIYADTIFKVTYAGRDNKNVEWLYPYPITDADKEILKYDAIKLIGSLQTEVKKYVGGIDPKELSDAFKFRR